MNEEYTSEMIEETRKQMKDIGYENVKKEMLNNVALTESFFSLEDLKEIMSEKEFQELLNDIDAKARTIWNYRKDKYPEETLEENKEEIQGKIKFIITNDNDEHKVKEYFARRDVITKSIDVNDIDGVKLANTIAKVMQRHLDYGVFYSNEYYSAEEIKRALIEDIDRMKKQKIVFEQDRDKIETEKEKSVTPANILESAIEATKGTKTSTIRGLAQGIGEVSKGSQIVEKKEIEE